MTILIQRSTVSADFIRKGIFEMSLSSKKRVVIVTGASRGLGKDIALSFGRAGERIVVNFRSNEKAALNVADEISQNGGESICYRADVNKQVEVEAMIKDTRKRWGAVDVLINNAALTKDRLVPRMTEEDWDEVIGTDLNGPFNCIRAVSQHMIDQRSGHIINISSIVGLQGREGQANYATAKAGLIGLTKASAKELGEYNVKVNAILPGYLRTDMGAEISAEVYARILQESVLGRGGGTSEVAAFIHHLSLMENVSGQVFNLDSRII
jgi:3-oxoacyl-[acyl-carrier protein] reductase